MDSGQQGDVQPDATGFGTSTARKQSLLCGHAKADEHGARATNGNGAGPGIYKGFGSGVGVGGSPFTATSMQEIDRSGGGYMTAIAGRVRRASRVGVVAALGGRPAVRRPSAATSPQHQRSQHWAGAADWGGSASTPPEGQASSPADPDRPWDRGPFRAGFAAGAPSAALMSARAAHGTAPQAGLQTWRDTGPAAPLTSGPPMLAADLSGTSRRNVNVDLSRRSQTSRRDSADRNDDLSSAATSNEGGADAAGGAGGSAGRGPPGACGQASRMSFAVGGKGMPAWRAGYAVVKAGAGQVRQSTARRRSSISQSLASLSSLTKAVPPAPATKEAKISARERWLEAQYGGKTDTSPAVRTPQLPWLRPARTARLPGHPPLCVAGRRRGSPPSAPTSRRGSTSRRRRRAEA